MVLYVGGRAMWLSFWTSIPAAYTVFGLWITFDRIACAVYTVLTAAGSLLILLYLRSTST